MFLLIFFVIFHLKTHITNKIVIIHCSFTGKKGQYTILNSLFVHIPLIYQISTYTGLNTRIFDFSHFCDFHILALNRTVIYQPTYQYFSLMPSCILICENFLFCFLPWSDIFFEILVMFLGYISRYTINIVINILNQCIWKYYVKISMKNHGHPYRVHTKSCMLII